jgi:putative pyruvate formate lyase activating enzyme
MAHPGEEPPLSGTGGSGTIFWSHCTLRCLYCQNYRMSQLGEGTERTTTELAGMMRSLSDQGCHNINLVSPTQYLPHVLEALVLAHEEGVALPVVWNTSGYESLAALELLDGVVDVYLSDIRYASEEAAAACSDAPDYVRASRSALVEMNRQVGELVLDEAGIAERGLIVRHLVLPSGLAGTRESMRFVAEELGRGTFVSLMAQYYPAHRAAELPELARGITAGEWEEARSELAKAGLERGWVQELPDRLYHAAGTEIRADESQ